MKSLKVSFILFAFIQAQLYGGIKNSHHDFSGSSWANEEVCRPCHTPHHANQDVPNAPLWNHEVTMATFDLYTSPSLNAFPGQPGGTSKLCLSCHDGTVAIENHGGKSDGTRYIDWGGLGTDLRDDHPISIVYDDALASIDGGLHMPSSTSSGLGGTISEDLLIDNKLECSSCHDVHLARNTQGCSGCHNMHSNAPTKSLSLRLDNTGSAFCLTCHAK